ncbi:MAG TPA: hypothetical protein VGG62_10580 [Terracidiphilus sp.]
MSIDERMEQLEHVTAAHIEQARKDYEENRRLWREQQTEIRAIWHRMEERDKHYQAIWDERDRKYKAEQSESRYEQASRDAVIDKRIGNLVTAIGELCRSLDQRP